ncbi:hypothetical protein ANN_21264 [Periplaneta americana]|uniref:Uncharacterized protein n=1 Tax=Periplaneta americana TaxID=6978 RepID=A0ABQ8SEU7_PERAM|nr:hypothetical protein ANN_21264 [Periplaneta americana]
MKGLCEGDNEPSGSLKAICNKIRLRKPVITAVGGAHRANYTIPPFWLDNRPPLLRHVTVRPAPGWKEKRLQLNYSAEDEDMSGVNDLEDD